MFPNLIQFQLVYVLLNRFPDWLKSLVRFAISKPILSQLNDHSDFYIGELRSNRKSGNN